MLLCTLPLSYSIQHPAVQLPVQMQDQVLHAWQVLFRLLQFGGLAVMLLGACVQGEVLRLLVDVKVDCQLGHLFNDDRARVC